MKEIQLVISIVEHPRLEEFKEEDPRVEEAFVVKLGVRGVGDVWRDAEGRWRWSIDHDVESEPFDRRIEAALGLVEYVHEEVDERDVYPYESKGLKIVLHGSQFLCTSCGQWRTGTQMGLRRINDRLVRSQPQCGICRSRKRKV